MTVENKFTREDLERLVRLNEAVGLCEKAKEITGYLAVEGLTLNYRRLVKKYELHGPKTMAEIIELVKPIVEELDRYKRQKLPEEVYQL